MATKTFQYETIDAKGARERGKVDAADESAASQTLRQRGQTPLSLTETGSGLKRDISIPGMGRVKLKDLSIFTRQFATLINSGMTLLRSLTIMVDQTANPRLRKALDEVRSDISNGTSLSVALAKDEKIFPPLMVAMVRAGEAGGLLDTTLERIAMNFEKDANLRAKIKGALTYPVIVLIFSGIMIAGVLIFIVPVFEGMFKQFGGDLPMPTQVIVTASNNMVWALPLLIILAVIGTTIMKSQLRRRPGLRLRFDRLKLRMPVFGGLLQKMAISRFSRNLGTLLGVGVPVLQALDSVAATTGNAVVAAAVTDLQTAVRDGLPMSAQLGKHKVFPTMVTQMMEVGEESGQISQMLEKLADFYDREVDSAADSLTAALEPIMVVVMGVLVGGMVVCLYLPMFSIYEKIQG
jgi:type IV pilus assembly protein PilC